MKQTNIKQSKYNYLIIFERIANITTDLIKKYNIIFLILK